MLFIFVEIAIVASVSWFTEIMPEARAVMMTGNVAAHSLGRTAGALLGGAVYSIGGFQLTSAASFVLGLCGAIVLLTMVPEFHSDNETVST